MISTAELAEKKFTGITLPAPYGPMLGKIPMDVSGAIWGPKGSGKSTMAVDLAYVLANELGKGIYCSSEEGPGPSMQGKIKRLGAEHPDLMVTDFEGLEDLKAAVKYSKSKFVVLDSASMGYVKLAEFEAFHDWCKDQNVMLWYILHATKDGNYKGNTMMVHMPDIEIKVCDGVAETEKNRFEETPRSMEVVFERGKRENPDKAETNSDERHDNLVIKEHFRGDTYGSSDFGRFKKWLKKNYPRKAEKAKEIWDTPEYGSDRPEPNRRLNPADEDLLYGIEYIENPDEVLRENRGVEPDDIYDMITDSIISVIEENETLPWQKRYGTGFDHGMATNFASKKPYRGINWVMLNFFKWIRIEGKKKLVEGSFKNPYYLTFNQVEELGGKVKKGAVAQKAFFFTLLYKYEQDDPTLEFGTYDRDKFIDWLNDHSSQINLMKEAGGQYGGVFTAEEIADQSVIPIVKYYSVFNGEDIEGIDFGGDFDAEKLSDEHKIDIAEQIFQSYPNKPELRHDEQKPYYNRRKDFINMPKFGSYDEPQYYYSTLFHESIHSTGHKSRLDREFGKQFGDEKYAFEELVAEMGAAYLSAEAGILFKTREQSAAYLKSWNERLVEAMKEHNKFFFRAASRSQEAADYILDRDADGVPAYRADVKVQRTNPETDTKCLVTTNAKTNDKKDGIEIRFSDAPPQTVRDKLKKAGFFFYTPNGKQPFWAAKKTAYRLDVAKEIAGEFSDGKRQAADVASTGNESNTSEKDSGSNESNTSKPKGNFVLGNETTVDFKADGSIQEQGYYAIMEVADVIPSHNKDCSPNSKHKISKGQPRDRSLDALCNQPKFIAQNLNPTSITKGNLAFNGASTVLPDGQVIQGNGRGIALKIAYDEHPQNAKKYKQYLIDHAGNWGLSKPEIKNFKQPVLVRVLDVSEDRAIELGNVVDTSQAKMSKVDQGKAYIRNLPKDRKQAIGNLINDSSGETIGEVIDDVGMRILDQINDVDRQGLVEDNGLTSEGKDFLRSVFAGLVFDSEENKQALQHFMNLKHTQKAGLERSYGNIIPFIDTEADIAPTIQKAVEIVAQVQRTDGIDTVDDFMNQSDAFTGANTDRFTEQEAQLAQFLLDQTTQKGIRDGFRMYQWKVNGKEDLFNPIDKVSPPQAFEDAFVKRMRINPSGDQVTLLPVSEFETGDIIRDFYDTDKFEVIGTKGDDFIIKNTRTGRKENIAADVKRFVPDRQETPTLSLFEQVRDNPDEPLIYIGTTEKITIDDGRRTKGLQGAFPTFVSEDKLFVVPEYRVREVANMVESEAAVAGYEEWHNYEADETDFEIDWPADKPAHPVGTAQKIWYASDKVIQPGDEEGKINHYVHEFDAGKRPAVVKGDILIVGNIDWNGRGLLN
ncbi:zincin-like metallopeptidase domain-containing protein [Halalkalibaculum sp. DA384]|uniref:zincin-like metallopeptidase domain-containing protein n=1 Tax=Halalkalibaculum sp. DA384 TaxID=3373606 RepID=UPI003754A57C